MPHNPERTPVFPQSRAEWIKAATIPLVACVAAVVLGSAYAWLDAHHAGVAMLLLLLLEPMLEQRAAAHSNLSSAHALHRGRKAVVTEACRPKGRVNLDGTTWTARSVDASPIAVGEWAYVHDGEGLVLSVGRQAPTGKQAGPRRSRAGDVRRS